MKVLETDRLILRWVSLEDAEFILGLLNEPSWLQFIGDKGVRTVEDARAYVLKGPVDMYSRLGFGLYLVELKESVLPIGMCGLIKRDTLEDVDIGFAFLPEYEGKGYGFESAAGVMEYGRDALGFDAVYAITTLDNIASIKLLEKLAFKFESLTDSPEGEKLRLFSYTYPAAA